MLFDIQYIFISLGLTVVCVIFIVIWAWRRSARDRHQRYIVSSLILVELLTVFFFVYSVVKPLPFPAFHILLLGSIPLICIGLFLTEVVFRKVRFEVGQELDTRQRRWMGVAFVSILLACAVPMVPLIDLLVEYPLLRFLLLPLFLLGVGMQRLIRTVRPALAQSLWYWPLPVLIMFVGDIAAWEVLRWARFPL